MLILRYENDDRKFASQPTPGESGRSVGRNETWRI